MQPVLVPNKVGSAWVHAVLLHASLEQGDNVTVVWILSKGKASTIVHELGKLVWLVLTKLFNFDFLLLFLDIRILFGLGSSRESLPWQRSFQKV
tara:strand:+ start:263 stop:544 length:282 start_codon:yes stop_codon:yes gene_type:complete